MFKLAWRMQKAIWRFMFGWIPTYFENKKLAKQGIKDVSKRQTKDLKKLWLDTKLFTSGEIPYVGQHIESGEHFIQVPAGVLLSNVEKKALVGVNQILDTHYTAIVDHGQGLGEFYRSKLPARVDYGEKPFGAGIWIGTDEHGKAVKIAFEKSPVMLITGASGSGKTILGNVICEQLKNNHLTIIDGKGGIDWVQFRGDAEILTEFEEVAAFMEAQVAEMKKRLAELLNIGKKNWKDAGWEPSYIFMDEASDFLNVGSKAQDKLYDQKWRIINAVSELARKSRAAGIFVIYSLQAAQADSVPTDVRNNAEYRVSYALPSAEMSRTLFQSDIAFDASLRNGKGAIKTPEGVRLFQGAFMEV